MIPFDVTEDGSLITRTIIPVIHQDDVFRVSQVAPRQAVAVCSATLAALQTGGSQHPVGAGEIADLASDWGPSKS